MLTLDVSRWLNSARSLENTLRRAAEGFLTERSARILEAVRAATPPSAPGISESQALERG